MNSIKDLTLILGSSSPRRHELISYLNLKVETLSPPFDESSVKEEDPKKLVCLIAQGKSSSILQMHSIENLSKKILMTADTIVYSNQKILGKPKDKSDAILTLKSMSGKTHHVYTCVNFSYLKNNETLEHRKIVTQTDVTFNSLALEEIEEYVETSEPHDKAGSYAIQGKGSFMVKSINGSYTNVVGLPLAETFDEIKSIAKRL